MSVENKSLVWAVMGTTGSGKGTFIKKKLQLEKPKRLIILDPMKEYQQFAPLTDSTKDVYQASKKSSFKIALWVDLKKPEKIKEQFKFISDLAYDLGNVWYVIDELSIFTSATYAAPEWQNCSFRGRHRGMTIIGASQRPTSIDKDFLSMASFIVSSRITYEPDQKKVAASLGVSKAELMSLADRHYIQRNTSTGEIKRFDIKI